MQSDDLLQFKDYTNTPSTSSPPAQINVNSPTHSTGSGSGGAGRQRGDPLSDLIYDMSNSAQILSGGMSSSGGGGGGKNTGLPEPATATPSKTSFLTIEYYQRFFDVDTLVVLERIANSMIPKRAPSNYLKSSIGQNPDLYGPFWITTTLIFCIAISGNIANYLQHQSETYQWHYNFHLVSYAATCIFIYANFLPGALWALFKYSLKPLEEGLETENADYTPSLLSLMCVYGYSLAIYIPVSILWVIQLSILQWLLVITAALLSGSVLIAVLTPALRNSKYSLFLIIGILAAHFLLAAGFMLYFFHVPSSGTVGAHQTTMEAIKQPVKEVLEVTKAVVGNITNK
ncbi:protein YIPF1 [Stomoxys calcitrans]|uniref:Protein YIPF n=1 Tax=Stomoxys calcitrans TaxID=35570 RepID=A0A1I8NY11_STOCA|nr:protein YIPF1 [Stomoxys calcitrans]